MLYILYGEDDFSLQEWLSELKEGADVQVLAVEKLTLGELLRIGGTLPFLAPRRLVIVEGLLSRFEPRGQSLE
ncbi:MAG: DNA polymerase III subunit delta, partial [Chloroflexi bacterium]